MWLIGGIGCVIGGMVLAIGALIVMWIMFIRAMRCDWKESDDDHTRYY